MNYFTILLLLTVFISCTNPSEKKVKMAQEEEVRKDTHSFLVPGSYYAEYEVNKEITAYQRRLLKKVSVMAATSSEAAKFLQQVLEGDKPVYHRELGIDRKEFNQLVDFFSVHSTERKKDSLTTWLQEGSIRFRGSGRLAILDSVAISTTGNFSRFGEHRLEMVTEPIDLSAEQIPAGDTIAKYAFYQGPGGIAGLMAMEGVYELLICKLQPGGGIYLTLFARFPDPVNHPVPVTLRVLFGK